MTKAVAETRPLTPVLELDDLAVHYPITSGTIRRRVTGAVRAVDGISLTIGPRETVGLVGESGSGKTTTGRAIIGLVPVTRGRIVFEGRDIRTDAGAATLARRRRVQMIFQNPFSSLNPRMTIGNIVADPLRVHGIGTEAARRERVMELFQLVGLDASLVNRYPHQFSGGQRQRVGIARALAMDPTLVICDEPVSALDVSIQAQILNLLTDLRERLGLAYLLISHDLAIVRHLSDRVAVMYLGRLMEVADRDRIYTEPRHPYTQALLAAVHVPDPGVERTRRDAPLRGEIPSPAYPPSGCRFHTRCPLRERLGRPVECVEADPGLRDMGGGHLVACHFAEQSDIDAIGGRPLAMAGPVGG
jgi:oligopeptide transport system ATP-binding protein